LRATIKYQTRQRPKRCGKKEREEDRERERERDRERERS
jgi:hypothetical protein